MTKLYEIIDYNNLKYTDNLNIKVNYFEQSNIINNNMENNKTNNIYSDSYLNEILNNKFINKNSKIIKNVTKTINKITKKKNMTDITDKNKDKNKEKKEHTLIKNNNETQLNIDIIKSYTQMDNFAILFSNHKISYSKIINTENEYLTLFIINTKNNTMKSKNLSIINYKQYLSDNNIHLMVPYTKLGTLKMNDLYEIIPHLNISVYNENGKRKLKAQIIQDIINYYEKNLNIIQLTYE